MCMFFNACGYEKIELLSGDLGGLGWLHTRADFDVRGPWASAHLSLLALLNRTVLQMTRIGYLYIA